MKSLPLGPKKQYTELEPECLLPGTVTVSHRQYFKLVCFHGSIDQRLSNCYSSPWEHAPMKSSTDVVDKVCTSVISNHLIVQTNETFPRAYYPSTCCEASNLEGASRLKIHLPAGHHIFIFGVLCTRVLAN